MRCDATSPITRTLFIEKTAAIVRKLGSQIEG
jgi:hypothetical protein